MVGRLLARVVRGRAREVLLRVERAVLEVAADRDVVVAVLEDERVSLERSAEGEGSGSPRPSATRPFR